MMMNKKVLFSLLAIIFFSAWPETSDAYKFNYYKGRPVRWPRGKAVFIALNVGPFKKIPAKTVSDTFRKALNMWKAVKCANTSTFLFTGMTNATATLRDKKNVIEFTNALGNILFRPNYLYDVKGNLTEVDIKINAKIAWSTKPQGNDQDLLSMALAVMGHFLGLATSTEAKATMGGSFMYGDISKRTLHPDDVNGICALYPNNRPQCSTDRDCAPFGLGCQASKCVQKKPPLKKKYCQLCQTNKDCEAGMVCDYLGTQSVCLQLCSPDDLCPNGQACNGTGVGAQCFPLSGVCPKQKCKTKADCTAPGYICKNGQCVPECVGDADCPKNKPHCQNGKCVASTGCLHDSDCASTEKCVNQKCVPKNPSTCTPKQTQSCTCANGQKGSQTCNADGKSWTPCQCQGGPGTCTPNQTQSCTCANGQKGSQTCNADGKSWSQCQCQGGPATCTPNQTQSCTCTNGQKGSQTCNADGKSWSQCQCQGGPATCTPNQTQSCTCANGQKGTQTCNADGKSWTPCQCQGGPVTCTPNQTQSCTCTNGQKGTQTCNADGKSWSQCQCQGEPSGCTPNQTQSCFCANGQQGSQTCNADGKSWTPCQCQGNNGGAACTPGQTQACVCTDGRNGSQICNTDGKSWGTCQCAPNNPMTCVAGQTKECVCSDGKKSTQTCKVDNSGWGECQCGQNTVSTPGTCSCYSSPQGDTTNLIILFSLLLIWLLAFVKRQA